MPQALHRVRSIRGRVRRAWEALAGRTPAARPAGSGPAQRIDLDYEVRPIPRWGYGRPPHPELQRLISAGEPGYRDLLESFLPLVDDLAAIPLQPSNAVEPSWHNGWYQGLDAVALYCLLSTLRPSRYVEVGSGNSTKFARRAITDHALPTKVTSLDPVPRTEIDALCDEIVRTRLEDADLAIFDDLREGDVLFIDGSHRCFMNSDVTVAVLEVLPRLQRGVLVHVHDVFLPWDYPPQIADWYWSEQYLIAATLLGGDQLEVVLPNFYISTESSLHRILAPLWDKLTWSAAATNGVGFWMRRR